MADAKDTTVELVAVERGFLNNKLIEPGTKFVFDRTGSDGKSLRKLPKWAVPAGEYRAKKAKAPAGDLRPKEAQEAAKQKAGQLGGAPA